MGFTPTRPPREVEVRRVPRESSLSGLGGPADNPYRRPATPKDSQDAIRESHQEGQVKKAQRRRNEQANQS